MNRSSGSGSRTSLGPGSTPQSRQLQNFRNNSSGTGMTEPVTLGIYLFLSCECFLALNGAVEVLKNNSSLTLVRGNGALLDVAHKVAVNTDAEDFVTAPPACGRVLDNACTRAGRAEGIAHCSAPLGK